LNPNARLGLGITRNPKKKNNNKLLHRNKSSYLKYLYENTTGGCKFKIADSVVPPTTSIDYRNIERAGTIRKDRGDSVRLVDVVGLPSPALVLSSAALLRILALELPACALAGKNKPPHRIRIQSRKKRREKRRSKASGRDTHLQVWSGLPSAGRPHAIFRSRQKRQARVCFFSGFFLLGLSTDCADSAGPGHIEGSCRRGGLLSRRGRAGKLCPSEESWLTSRFNGGEGLRRLNADRLSRRPWWW
jgi:hypothetical protein